MSLAMLCERVLWSDHPFYLNSSAEQSMENERELLYLFAEVAPFIGSARHLGDQPLDGGVQLDRWVHCLQRSLVGSSAFVGGVAGNICCLTSLKDTRRQKLVERMSLWPQFLLRVSSVTGDQSERDAALQFRTGTRLCDRGRQKCIPPIFWSSLGTAVL